MLGSFDGFALFLFFQKRLVFLSENICVEDRMIRQIDRQEQQQCVNINNGNNACFCSEILGLLVALQGAHGLHSDAKTVVNHLMRGRGGRGNDRGRGRRGRHDRII